MFLPFASKSKTNKSGKIILQKFDKKRFDQKMIKSICQMKSSVDNNAIIHCLNKTTSQFKKQEIKNQIHFNNVKMIKKIVEIREDSNKKCYEFNHNPEYNQFKKTRSKLKKFVRNAQQKQIKKQNSKLLNRILRTTSTFSIYDNQKRQNSSQSKNKIRKKSLKGNMFQTDSLRNIILGQFNNYQKQQTPTKILRSKTSCDIERPQRKNKIKIKTELNQTQAQTQLTNKKQQMYDMWITHGKTVQIIDLNDLYLIKKRKRKSLNQKAKQQLTDNQKTKQQLTDNKIINKNKLLANKNLFLENAKQQQAEQIKNQNKNKRKALCNNSYHKIQNKTRNKSKSKNQNQKQNKNKRKTQIISFTQQNLLDQMQI